MRFTVPFAFLCFLAFLGCNKKISPDATPGSATSIDDDAVKIVTFNEVIGLAMGETAKVEKTTAMVSFLSVSSDNRCPRGVNCITEGEASVVVSLMGNAPQRVRIEPDPKRTTRLGMENATVEILGLDPYPEARIRIDPAQRRLRVRFIKAAKMR